MESSRCSSKEFKIHFKWVMSILASGRGFIRYWSLLKHWSWFSWRKTHQLNVLCLQILLNWLFLTLHYDIVYILMDMYWGWLEYFRHETFCDFNLFLSYFFSRHCLVLDNGGAMLHELTTQKGEFVSVRWVGQDFDTFSLYAHNNYYWLWFTMFMSIIKKLIFTYLWVSYTCTS